MAQRLIELPERYGLPLLIAAMFATCSFGLYPLTQSIRPSNDGAILVFSCIGAISGATALIAIWAVLGSKPFWLRMLLGFGGALLLLGFWIIGYTLSARAVDIDLVVLFCLPLVFLAIQLPLWLVRLVFRWEIVLLSSNRKPPNIRPLTIRDLLIAMGIIGLGLASARFGKSLLKIPSDSEFWIFIGIVIAICTTISLASTLPIVVATMRAGNPAVAMFGIGFYATFALTITLIVLEFMQRTPGVRDIFCLFTVVVTFVATIATPLLLARRRGFRLRWGREAIN